MTSASGKPIILTCCQPTSHFHLGNYLGGLQRWANMQDDYECFFGIVDFHAMTAPYVPADLRRNTLECAAQYIACGLDPQRSHIFVQSHVTGHTELAWILGCLAPLGQLERMTQFKDKSKRIGNSVGAGLFFYPVLQAADILLYNADAVPVGEDQKQHLELVRDLAQKFNNTYSETFKLPEPLIGKAGARVMALQDPSSKMSKSDKNYNNTLFLFEPKESLRKKVMSAVTDSGNDVYADESKPGVTNLMGILSAISGQSYEEISDQFSGKGYASFKEAVADAVIAAVEPLQERYKELINDKEALHAMLKAGAEVAQKRAYKTLSKVYRKTGLLERIH